MEQVVIDSALLTSYGVVYLGEHQLVNYVNRKVLYKCAIYNNVYTPSVRSLYSEYGWRACIVLLKKWYVRTLLCSVVAGH